MVAPGAVKRETRCRALRVPGRYARSERVRERVATAANEAREVDHVVVQRELVLGLEIAAVERGIVGREAVRHAVFIEAPNDFAQRHQVLEGSGLQVRARTHLEADVAAAELGEQR